MMLFEHFSNDAQTTNYSFRDWSSTFRRGYFDSPEKDMNPSIPRRARGKQYYRLGSSPLGIEKENPTSFTPIKD